MPGADLDIVITNRDGDELARPPQWQAVEVVIPLNDSRTAKVQLPIWDTYAGNDAATAHILPLSRCLKIRYRDRLIFNGPITLPEWDLAANTVTVNAHDASLFLKNHYFEADDEAVTLVDLSADGIGMWVMMLASSIDTGMAEGGIVAGTYTSYTNEDLSIPVEIGDNVWDKVTELSQQAPIIGALDGGPDFSLTPIDADYDPDNNWEAGATVQLDTWQDRGIDRSEAEPGGWVGHYGWGAENLAGFVYAPDGARLRNEVIVSNRVRTITDGSGSSGSLGQMQAFFTMDEKTGISAMEAKAAYELLGYGQIPEFFTIALAPESGPAGSDVGVPPRYGTGYLEGDVIRAIGRLGNFERDLSGRVMKVTLTQVNQEEMVQASLECAGEQNVEGGGSS